MAVVQREYRKRGFFGKVAKFLFIAFNLLMLAWFVLTLTYVVQDHDPAAENAVKAGEALAVLFGTTAFLVLWVLGDIILGLLVLLSRGQKIMVTEEQ